MSKIKILFLVSNPLTQDRLALDEECREITAKIRSAEHRDAIELIAAWAVRPPDLQELLLQHRPACRAFQRPWRAKRISQRSPDRRTDVSSGHDRARQEPSGATRAHG